MLNPIQPFLNLTNANIETFARFAKSREISDVTKAGVDTYIEFVNDSLTRVVQSDAFAEWTRGTVNNYSSFIKQYTQSVFAIVAQSQEFMSHQAEEGTRSLQQISEATSRAVNAAGADAVKKSAAR